MTLQKLNYFLSSWSKGIAKGIPYQLKSLTGLGLYYTVIELNGRDRPGLLYDVTSALTKTGIQISSSHISTYGERVVDVFYVKDIFGLKIISESKLKQIRTLLLESIDIE